MERWEINLGKDVITPIYVDKYLEEIEQISKRYNLSISHEDCHGAFIIEKYDKLNIKWLNDCLLNLKYN